MLNKGQIVGYIRVSTTDQNPERQKALLAAYELDELFTEYASAKNRDRPQLINAFRYLRKDDTLIVPSMDRLARNLQDLIHIVNELTNRGVKIQFIKESLIFTGQDSPMSKLLLSLLGAFAEFERSLIKERQMEGICLAKSRGVYKGRQRKLSNEKLKELIIKDNANNGKDRSMLASELGISRQTLYNYLRMNNIQT